MIEKCKKCGCEFKWVQILKSLFSGYSPIICKYCNEKYKIKVGSRFFVALSISLPLFVNIFLFNKLILPPEKSILVFVGYILYIICIFTVMPFVVSYKEIEK